MTKPKLLKEQFPLLLKGDNIPRAKQLKHKQTSTTSDQIRIQFWTLTSALSPQDVGRRAEHPFPQAFLQSSRGSLSVTSYISLAAAQ